MKVTTKILLGFVAIILCCITACQIHYYKARRTPAVSGKVMDIETGEPIKEADVMVAVYGFPADPLAIATPHRLTLTRQYLKTDNQGRFFFPSQVPPLTNVGFSWLSYMIWGPCHQLAIGVYVFPKEYMTVASESEGFGWKEDPYIASGPRRENGDVLVSATRQAVNPLTYDYAIGIRKAESEKEWEIKCHTTLFHYQDVAHWERLNEPGETCLFNDLVGYLERYPNAEKAGEYFYELLGTQPYSCNTLQEHWRDGDFKKSQILLYSMRNAKILELADKVNLPAEPIRRKCTLEDIESRKKVTNCFESLLKRTNFTNPRGQVLN